MKHLNILLTTAALCAIAAFTMAQSSGPVEIRRGGGSGGISVTNGNATNLTVYSSTLGSNALQVYSAAGLSGFRVDGNGLTRVDRGLTSTNITAYGTIQLEGTTYLNGTVESSGNNVFTGTNTFSTNTVLGTNRVVDFVTVGSRYRTLYVGASNYFTGTPGTLETNLYASITLPPLMSEKSQILCGYRASKTNITTQPIWWWEFRADTTNGTVIAGFGALAAASYWQGSAPVTFVMENEGFDYQFVGPFAGYVATVVPSVMNWNTLASTNVLHVLLHHGSAASTDPITVRSFVLIERY